MQKKSDDEIEREIKFQIVSNSNDYRDIENTLNNNKTHASSVTPGLFN